jgi:hypothetical protein
MIGDAGSALPAKTVRLRYRLGLYRLGSAFVLLVQMYGERLAHSFAFCQDGSLEQRMLNFWRKFTPAPRHSLPQSPVNLLNRSRIRGTVIRDFAGKVQLRECRGQGLILRSLAGVRKKNVPFK